MPIKSPGALSLCILYEKYHLPKEEKLHIYNFDKSQIIGAFTEKNNKGSQKKPGKFATGLVYGDEIILEYYYTKDAAFERILSIAGVVHGYKHIRLPESLMNRSSIKVDETDTGTNGGSGTCQ